jgi:hypothetical protein
MTVYQPNMDAAPVAVSGQVGTTMSLYDFLKQSYGDNVNQLQSVYINVNAVSGAYWNGTSSGTATAVKDAHGVAIGSGGENIDFSDFKNVQITIGNNINSNVFVTVPESSGNGPFVGHTLGVSVLPTNLESNHAADHVPTAADVVAAAKMFATTGVEGGVFNHNDCHGIASAIAASAGATLDPDSYNTTDVASNPNEQSGFWRIAATGSSVPGNWTSTLQPGDIVRYEHAGGPHTFTVVSAPDANGNFQVVDNSNDHITQHSVNPATDINALPGTITIYRLTTDGQYLIDQSSHTTNDNILGDGFNDLIKVGSGNDTVNGGVGTDTVVFAGKMSDYSVAHNPDGTVSVTMNANHVTDKLTSVEKIQFSDQTIDTNPTPIPTPVPTPVPVPVPAPAVSIADATVTEGNHGTVIENFVVTRATGSGNGAFDVNFKTSDGTATVTDGDYNSQSNTLHFAAGVNSQTIQVVVNGDTKVEPNETYNVTLSGATNGATITHAQATGTIVNDDVAPPPAPTVSVGNATVTEGNNGTVLENFVVTRGAGSGNGAFDVNFATSDGTATVADKDYNAQTGTLHFAAGQNSQTITVAVNGDTKVEGNETYNVNLSGATNGATITNAHGVGTIVDDDVSGSLSIANASVSEGNNGTVIENFIVTRSGGNAPLDVHFATSDGTATVADHDYNANSGTLHFNAGDNTATISVVVNSDTKIEGNETYDVTLSGATNGATISHAQGIGTIVNDDTAPTVTPHVSNDFNGDGISDSLLGNNNGSVAMWQLNGNHIDSNTTVGSISSAWHSDGIADFNGDGKADVLWQNASGQVAMWQMNGDHVASNTTVGSVGTDWHAIGTGDFNGDGKADVVWENSKGQVAMWEMNGDHIASNTTVGSIGTDWKAIGVGDFNGDGKADILWENSKGQVAEWQMNGDHIASNTTVGSVGSAWHAAGIGDFNGDGKADVLWQNTNGQVAQWQMNGDHIASNTTVGSAAGSTVIGTGDYNHDGKADVLLQTASGNVTEWQMNGDHISASVSVGSHSSDWHMV